MTGTQTYGVQYIHKQAYIHTYIQAERQTQRDRDTQGLRQLYIES